MSSTNKTTYYELPQFVDNDIFNPLVDDNDAYNKIDTALHNIANAEADDASEIVGIKSRLDSAEGDIDALEAQNGNSVLTTTAQTLSGAVNELDADASALDGRLDIVEDDINNASTGLKVKVNALETQNGSETLDTTAQTLSGAVNELKGVTDDNTNDIKLNFLNSEFIGQRYGSTDENYGQSAIHLNNKFYIAGDRHDATGFKILVTNEALEKENEYLYTENVHPNGMFTFDNFIYIVDSQNNDILKINPLNMNIIDTITSFEANNVNGGYFYNDKVYLIGGTTIYVCDKEFSLVKTIVHDAIPVTNNLNTIVRQGLFVYDNYIYLVCNRPNSLIIYDMDGKLVGTKVFDEGDGYYPYGEVETFFPYDDDIYMFTTWHQFYHDLSDDSSPLKQIGNIFKTNIVNPILNSNYYGQELPTDNIIYANSTATKTTNPSGSYEHPFTDCYEASCVANYLATHIANGTIELSVIGDFSNNVIIINNCTIGIHLDDNAVVKTVEIVGCDTRLYSGTVTNLRVVESTFTDIHGTLVTNAYFNSSVLTLQRCEVSGKLTFQQCYLTDGAGGLLSDYSDISNVFGINVPSIWMKCQGKSPLSTEFAFSGFFRKICMEYQRASNTLLSICARYVDGDIARPFHIDISLETQIKQAIYNDPTHIEDMPVVGFYNDGTSAKTVILNFKIGQTGITLDSGTVDGGAITKGNLYFYSVIATTYVGK